MRTCLVEPFRDPKLLWNFRPVLLTPSEADCSQRAWSSPHPQGVGYGWCKGIGSSRLRSEAGSSHGGPDEGHMAVQGKPSPGDTAGWGEDRWDIMTDRAPSLRGGSWEGWAELRAQPGRCESSGQLWSRQGRTWGASGEGLCDGAVVKASTLKLGCLGSNPYCPLPWSEILRQVTHLSGCHFPLLRTEEE